ncbi:DUF3097 domain-containing protein [Leifsonia sp. H3M29-4]|uniref:DUF3097 domain-containing protein n=1 Tax=Salinibacterium metalliresistens TaxID=3031321 RepID=UPI0023DC1047|nr:DUF3097 domain-containing protein [Salinibacterium metalliresistens]MDF1478562.1 DUF3097 domain-containing protein [Salinibacterium metalliresistens]
MTDDRYGSDVLAGFRRQRGPSVAPRLSVEPGLVVETTTGFVGAVVAHANGLVELEDRHGTVRSFPLGTGFLVDGAPVELVKPVAAAAGPKRTASGSLAVAEQRARTALPSRIFVEGRHDAELVERIWGDDLRIEGVVVEYLEGVDHLPAVLREFRPGPARKVGVLVDHLVPGSKESRMADAVMTEFEHVLVVGHPFIDVWQGVKPQRLGIAAWPVVPRGVEWKHGVCEALGWPHETQADIARAWQHILSKVGGFTDLEPALLGRVEELIDYVTAG